MSPFKRGIQGVAVQALSIYNPPVSPPFKGGLVRSVSRGSSDTGKCP